MGGKSDYFRNLLLDAEFRGQSIAFPSTVYISLFKGDPLAGGVEVSGPVGTTGYQPFAVACTVNDWNATQGGTGSASSGTTGRISNAGSITFGTPLVDWTTPSTPLTHFAIRRDSTTGQIMRSGQIATPRFATAGSTAITFPPDSFAIYEV